MIYLIAGRTASGKDTIANTLKEDYGFKTVKSRTTREKRFPEEDTHVFVDTATAIEELCQSVADTCINGYLYYAMPMDVCDADCYVIDIDGITKLAKSLPDTAMHVIYVTSADEDRHARFIEREKNTTDPEALWKERNDAEAKQFDDFEEALKADEPIGVLKWPANIRRISVVVNKGDISELQEVAASLKDYKTIHDKVQSLAQLAIDNYALKTRDGKAVIYDTRTQEPLIASADVLADIIWSKPEDLYHLMDWALLETDLLDAPANPI